MATQFIITQENEMLTMGQKLAACCDNSAVIYLKGDLGVGKTTLVRGFLRGLNYQDKVKSPTFTLVEPYFFANKVIYHFDLYRLKNPEELLAMGIEDYFHERAIVLIEWPEKGEQFLNPADLEISLSLQKDNQRLIEFLPRSEQGQAILNKLK